ncbi:hypothetical protein PILCRDRAFT_272765 [Piloderma croceum F 1598]|uniref:Uncharacterized protein n=1 Tax=Piloderma croceum (strain F 1598) TaxID=765440 RepID=A0A0C3FT12_PILCF|nr:hypothetical protein PILCRDRAFT_272765 [Piloderma croceum F 1598]
MNTIPPRTRFSICSPTLAHVRCFLSPKVGKHMHGVEVHINYMMVAWLPVTRHDGL